MPVINCVTRLRTWNVRRINGTAKKEEVELLALTETKLKRKGEVSRCSGDGKR